MVEPTAEITHGIDFDSTFVASETLCDLADIALEGDPEAEARKAQIKVITNLAMIGQIPFHEALAKRLSLFSATQDHIDKVIERTADAIAPSVMRNADWFRKNKDGIYIISGGFEEIITPIACDIIGLNEGNILANSFTFDENGVINGFDPNRHLAWAGGKVSQVSALAVEGLFIMTGDGDTDAEVKARGQADEFWVSEEVVRREEVVAQADRVFPNFDGIVEAAEQLSKAT